VTSPLIPSLTLLAYMRRLDRIYSSYGSAEPVGLMQDVNQSFLQSFYRTFCKDMSNCAEDEEQISVNELACERKGRAGNLQQQAACVGALQALAFCPAQGSAIADSIAASSGCLEHLLGLLKTGPLPLRSLAAGALCNLALGNPSLAVRCSLICKSPHAPGTTPCSSHRAHFVHQVSSACLPRLHLAMLDQAFCRCRRRIASGSF
jgi:hypothetical protein